MKGLGSGKDGPLEKAGSIFLDEVVWRSYRAYPIATFCRDGSRPRQSPGHLPGLPIPLAPEELALRKR